MKRFSLIILILVLIISLLSGCGPDSNEVDNQVYVIALGCDKSIENKVRITIQFPTYQDMKGSGGQSSSQEKKSSTGGGGKEGNMTTDTLIETIEAPSILEGINLLNTSMTRKISLVHTKAVIFSEAMAREGIESYLAPIARYRDTRRTMNVIISRCSAEDYIKENKAVVGQSTVKAMELFAQLSNATGYFPQVSFQTFYTSMLSPYEQPYAIYSGINEFSNLEEIDNTQGSSGPLIQEYSLLPGEVIRRGNRKTELLGTAIFNGPKMIGTLDSYETRYFLMVTGKFGKGFFTLSDKTNKDKGIILDLRLGRKPHITVSFKDDKPVINIKLNIEADIGAIQSRVHYEHFDKIEDLNKQLEDVVKKGVLSTIKKTQELYNIDIFGFGKKIAWKFKTVTEFEEYNWLRHYKDAEIKVAVDANVRRTGVVFESSRIRNNKETIISEGEQ